MLECIVCGGTARHNCSALPCPQNRGMIDKTLLFDIELLKVKS
jgi:hypothetical protein